jgi:hypothetical protein
LVHLAPLGEVKGVKSRAEERRGEERRGEGGEEGRKEGRSD